MYKVEIFQTGKLPPLTVVECDRWEINFDSVPRIKFIKNNCICAEFFLNNIAGFKETNF